MEFFLQEVEKNVNKPYDISYLLHISVSNIICSIVFGNRYEYNDPEFIEQMEEIWEELRLSAISGILNFFPFLRYLPGDPFNSKRVQTLIDSQIRRIAKHIDAHKDEVNPDIPRDYVDALLVAQTSNNWLTGTYG